MPPRYSAIVMGASAGALESLSQILPALPAQYPLPILVVVHLPRDKRSVMAELLQARCAVAVKEAEDKEPVKPGVVYIAPPDYHLQVETGRWLSLSSDEPVLHSRPSIDVLFESAADVYGPALVGVILTGANQDGAHGLSLIAESGGLALVQSPGEAYAGTMPEAALKACPGAQAMNLEQLSHYLQKDIVHESAA